MAKAAQQLLAPSSAAVPGSPAGSLFWDIRCSFHSLTAVLILGLVVGVVYLTGESENILSMLNQESTGINQSSSSSTKCDLFSGKWVYDNQSYPLYKEQECTFMSDQLACQKFGRKDLDYQHWRWQPNHCNLPRFWNSNWFPSFHFLFCI